MTKAALLYKHQFTTFASMSCFLLNYYQLKVGWYNYYVESKAFCILDNYETNEAILAHEE